MITHDLFPSGGNWSLFHGVPSFRYNGIEMKRKTTVYIDDDLLRAARVTAARSGKRDSQVVEEALRAHLGFELLCKRE